MTGLALGWLVVLGVIAAVIPWPRTVDNGFITAGVLALWVATVLTATLIAVPVVIARRGRRLDRLFGALGLEGRRYLISGRQHHGTVGGRQTDVYFSKGPRLEIFVATPLKTRLKVGVRGALTSALRGATAGNLRPIAPPDPSWGGYDAYGLDERWSQALLSHPVARQVIQGLLAQGGSPAGRWVTVTPEAVTLQLMGVPLEMIHEENARRWVSSLVQLAQVAESLPAPLVTDGSSELERQARLDRGPINRKVTCGLLIFLALLTLFVTALTLGALALSGNLGRY